VDAFRPNQWVMWMFASKIASEGVCFPGSSVRVRSTVGSSWLHPHSSPTVGGVSQVIQSHV
jgi:hypothetical protein